MSILKWMSEKSKNDKIMNEFIHGSLGITLIGD